MSKIRLPKKGAGKALVAARIAARIKTVPCTECGISFMPHWLKDGLCNACRNPQSVVKAVV